MALCNGAAMIPLTAPPGNFVSQSCTRCPGARTHNGRAVLNRKPHFANNTIHNINAWECILRPPSGGLRGEGKQSDMQRSIEMQMLDMPICQPPLWRGLNPWVTPVSRARTWKGVWELGNSSSPGIAVGILTPTLPDPK